MLYDITRSVALPWRHSAASLVLPTGSMAFTSTRSGGASSVIARSAPNFTRDDHPAADFARTYHHRAAEPAVGVICTIRPLTPIVGRATRMNGIATSHGEAGISAR